MADTHHPRRGSKAYSPRKRAQKPVAHIKSWPESNGGETRIQGFAGYKAGMTHVLLVDYRPTSTTSGQEVQLPVTVVEVPPLKVAGIRVYENDTYGLRTAGEVWAPKLDKEVKEKKPVPKKYNFKKAWAQLQKKDVDDIRIIAHTQPKLVTGVPKKVPEIMELRVAGGTIEERMKYARGLLGKDITLQDFAKEGDMVDVIAVTKGKGFQGHVKRWGVKLLHHKNSKHRRMIGTQGPWHPEYVLPTVPQAGQTGYHQRTEYNKRLLKIGDNGEEITPEGGFLHYGVVRNSYVLVHGSIPGSNKRLVRFRDPMRMKGVKVDKAPEFTHISTQSKQGR